MLADEMSDPKEVIVMFGKRAKQLEFFRLYHWSVYKLLDYIRDNHGVDGIDDFKVTVKKEHAPRIAAEIFTAFSIQLSSKEYSPSMTTLYGTRSSITKESVPRCTSCGGKH